MAEHSTIEWTHHTWSPWIGCQKVSPACDGCYAEHLMDTRMGRVEWGPHGERKRTSDAYWRSPIVWNRAAAAAGRIERVFPSLCDPFDNQADPAVRRDFFDLIRSTPSLLWLLLTKRPQNIVAMAEAAGGLPENAAIGATCEDQQRADLNVPALLDAARDLRPAFTFLSCEPLLGPIDLVNVYDRRTPLGRLNALRAYYHCGPSTWDAAGSIDWVITGGETDQGKHKARPSHPDWFRQIRDACAAAGVPYLFKQWGAWAPSSLGPEIARASAEERVFRDGEWTGHAISPAAAAAPNIMNRVGKKVAGRLLDGVTHDGFPEAHR
jgi:protein gp37